MKENKKQKKQEKCERVYFNKIEVDGFDIIITVDMQNKKHNICADKTEKCPQTDQ